jgi:hypothetical protein
VVRRQGAHRWTRHGKVLSSSTTSKRLLHRAIGLNAELTEEVGRRWGGGGGRRGGVLVEGGSGGVAAASGAVLWLEVEARGELRRSGMKSTVPGGGESDRWRVATPF